MEYFELSLYLNGSGDVSSATSSGKIGMMLTLHRGAMTFRGDNSCKVQSLKSNVLDSC